MWSWCLLVVIVTLSDASAEFIENKSEYMNSFSTNFEEDQIISTRKATENGAEDVLRLQETENSKAPNTYLRIRRALESVVNSTVQSELSVNSTRTDYTNVTESIVLKTNNDSVSDGIQPGHVMQNSSANVGSNITGQIKINSNTDKDFEDINQLVIVLGVVSVIMMVILAAVASTVVMKRKKRHADEMNLSSQYTALLD